MEHPPEAKLPGDVSHALRVAATVLRTLFIILSLGADTARQSAAKRNDLDRVRRAGADLVRLILGVGVCAWLVCTSSFRCLTMPAAPARGFISGWSRCRLL